MDKFENLKKLVGCIKYERAREAENLFEDILEYIKDVEEERDDAVRKMKEWNKDVELETLRKQLSEYRKRSEFVLTEEEDEAVTEWCMKHRREKHGKNSETGCGGGTYTYEFTPTSIGTAVSIKCSC